jgi:hypothetical protein
MHTNDDAGPDAQEAALGSRRTYTCVLGTLAAPQSPLPPITSGARALRFGFATSRFHTGKALHVFEVIVSLRSALPDVL